MASVEENWPTSGDSDIVTLSNGRTRSLWTSLAWSYLSVGGESSCF